MKLYYYIVIVVALLVLSVDGWSQPRARVAGLEGNKTYMALLAEESALQRQEDSLNRSVENTREKFRSDPENRAKYSAAILQIEGQLFDVRNKLGQVAVKITTIEQDFVINSLNSGKIPVMTTNQSDTHDAEGNDKRVITQNKYFEKHLTGSDLRTLAKAQSQEQEVMDCMKQYEDNYRQVAKLAGEYTATDDPVIADSLYSKYSTISGLNEALSDSLSRGWSYIFDNKSYLYSYLLDKLNNKELLGKYADKLRMATQQIAEQQGVYQSDDIVEYAYGKRLLTEYEIMVADLLKMTQASDSLKRALKELANIDHKLARIELPRREFIKYDTVDVVLPTIYGTRNPIPTLEIPPRGVVYRVMLGSYTMLQSPSVFKGAQPLYVHKDAGRYYYYAGGFRTLQEAVDAAELLKKKWLRNARVVKWENGERHVISDEKVTEMMNEEAMLRVEIISEGEFSDQMLETIRVAAPDKEVSRVGNQYIVGVFTNRVSAQELVDAIQKTDPELEIRIVEVANPNK